jgi:hypothetical protein
MDITKREFDESIAAHKDCEAECDRLRASNAVLVEALELALAAIDNSLRSAGSSTAGFIAARRLMAKAEKAARAAMLSTESRRRLFFCQQSLPQHGRPHSS